jgi:hypothetical protein
MSGPPLQAIHYPIVATGAVPASAARHFPVSRREKDQGTMRSASRLAF